MSHKHELPSLNYRDFSVDKSKPDLQDLVMGKGHTYANFTSVSSMGLMRKYQSKGHVTLIDRRGNKHSQVHVCILILLLAYD